AVSHRLSLHDALPISALVAADHRGALDECLRRPLEGGAALDRPVGHEGPEPARAVRLDAVESGHAVQAHHVARRDLAPPHLDDEVRAAGQEAALLAEPRPEGDRVGDRARLVALEAHGVEALAGRPFVTGRTRSPKSRAVTRGGHTTPSSAAARRMRGAIRWSLASDRRKVGPETATAPTTRPPATIGA